MHDLEHKTIPSGGVHATGEEGVVEALVSVTGIEDNVGDIILPGAYTKTLAKRTPKGVWSHDWNTPVSKVKSIEELMPGDTRLPKTLADGSPWPAEAGALYVKAEFNLKTAAGRDAYENVTFFGDTCEWSIGYKVPRGESERGKNGVRNIKSLELFEFSPVLFGAASNARSLVTSIKSMFGSEEDWRKAVMDSLDEKTGEEKLDENGEIVEVIEDEFADKKCDCDHDEEETIVATVDQETGVVTDLEEEKADEAPAEEKSDDEFSDEELIAAIEEEEKSDEARSESKTLQLTPATLEMLQSVQSEIKALLDAVMVVEPAEDETKTLLDELETKSVEDAVNDLAAGSFNEKSVDEIAGKVEQFSAAVTAKNGEEVKSYGIAVLDLIDASIGDANADEEHQLKVLAKSIGDEVAAFDETPEEKAVEAELETKELVTMSEEELKALFQI